MKYELGQFVQTQLPRHFLDENPRFVRLMELYYQWLYRKDGPAEDEIDFVRADISKWSKVDIDRFVQTNSPRFNSFRGSDEAVVAEVLSWRAPGAISERFQAQYFLEREFDSFVTADGDYFLDGSGVPLETSFVIEDVIQNWANKFNMERLVDSVSLNPHDEILLLKSMKMMYAAKGTQKCIELFFKVYFNEDITVYIPKHDILAIDGAPSIDMPIFVRDDWRFQEFCYVIQTTNDPAPYRDVFERIYLKQFHPGGFNVIMEQKP
jgi:hypothetical protein